MDVIEWLLDSDPAIRWQVMRDLLREPEDVVAAERARVATEGWGARLLALQDADGNWGGAPFVPRVWTPTLHVLPLLCDFGLDPAADQARTAIGRLRDNITSWGPVFGSAYYFEGEVEPCINGRVLASGAYFGAADERMVDRLLAEQLPDGGWNCEAPQSTRSSFHSTICVLEGLLEYERSAGARLDVTDARGRGQEYLLERRMFRSLSTGEVIDPDWLELSYPTYWHYDVLRGLDYLRRAGVPADGRVDEALSLVESKRGPDGRWSLENVHEGEVHFPLENGEGTPSRWITLRALRVVEWSAGARARSSG
jgi:hypothetical protein